MATRFAARITSSCIQGLPYLLIELFFIGMPVVRTDSLSGRQSVHDDVITKFSRMGRLLHFLTHGAMLVPFVCESSATRLYVIVHE